MWQQCRGATGTVVDDGWDHPRQKARGFQWKGRGRKRTVVGPFKRNRVVPGRSTCPGAGMGLFANARIQKGEAVTEYDGTQVWTSVIDKRGSENEARRSHTVRLPGEDIGIDGKDICRCFQLEADPETGTSSYRIVKNTASVTRQAGRSVTVLIRDTERTFTVGLGAMANSSMYIQNGRTFRNTEIKTVATGDAGRPTRAFLVATRDIEAGEEILWRYQCSTI